MAQPAAVAAVTDASPLVGLKPCSRCPAEPCTSIPSYIQLSMSYSRSSGSQPEKRPSRSSVSANSSSMITGAFV